MGVILQTIIGCAVRQWLEAARTKTGQRDGGDHRVWRGVERLGRKKFQVRSVHRLRTVPGSYRLGAQSRAANTRAIWQDLVSEYGFASSYQSVQRFVRKRRGTQTPEARVVIITVPGQEARVDYGTGLRPMACQTQLGFK